MHRFTLIAIVALITTALQAQVPSYVPTNGLVGWWPFNGNANDESGSGNNGLVTGATLALDRYGNVNKAYDFDGIDDLISVQDNPNGSLDVQSGPFSISCWVLIETIGNNTQGLVGKEQGANSSGDYSLTILNSTNGGRVQLAVGMGQGLGAIQRSQDGITSSMWKHIVCVYQSGTSMNVFIDGVQNNGFSNPLSSSPNGNTSLNLLFGKSTNLPNNEYYFNGALDDIGIWNRALTPAEIQALYDAQSSPCVSPEAVSFSGLNSGYLTSDAPTILSGTPTGGVFIGPGMNGSTFSPASAGEGNHSISYTYLDENNCVNTFSLCTSVALGMGVEPGVNALGGVRVFPNPNRGQFTVELELRGLVSMQVFDARGALVHSEVFNASGTRTQHTLELRDPARGRYSLQIQNAGATITQQLIIE